MHHWFVTLSAAVLACAAAEAAFAQPADTVVLNAKVFTARDGDDFAQGFAITRESDIKGSIAPGKLADFAVLSDDLMTVEAAKIPAIRALVTYVGGREMYRDALMK